MERQMQIRNGDKTRTAILEVSATLFTQKGFLGASISDIAGEVGISKSSIYHYFSSKDEILFVIIDTFVKDVEELIKKATEEKLKQQEILVAFANLLVKHKNSVRLAPIFMPGAPPEVYELVESHMKKLHRILIPGAPSKEKMTRVMLALFGMVASIVQAPQLSQNQTFSPDLNLLVKIAMDTLGTKK